MSEYLLIEQSNYSQEAWTEARNEKDRLLKVARPARDEKLITIRLDRQFTAKLRLPTAKAAGAKRHANIEAEVARVMLGREVAPGVQVVEYECRLSEAQEAMVSPEERDEAGNVVREESYTSPSPERIDHLFCLRIDGRDLVKRELSPEEFGKADWKSILAGKVERAEAWQK